VKRWRVGGMGKRLRRKMVDIAGPHWVAHAAITGAASAVVATLIATTLVRGLAEEVAARVKMDAEKIGRAL
jgi:hypothetical protein